MNATENIEKIIFDKIDSMKDEIIKFHQELIQIPSEVIPGKYKQISKFVAAKMEEFGMNTKVKRKNVIGELGGDDGPSLIFNAHMDTVPIFDGWTKDPYSGEIIDDKIYGRGSSDDKSCVAAEIFAVKALLDAGVDLKGKLIVTAVVNEEIGGIGGAEYIVNEGIVKGDACLLGDGACEYPTAYRGGMLVAAFTIKGVRSHVMSYPDLNPPNRNKYSGINAIQKMLKIMNFLDGLQKKFIKKETKYPIYPDLPSKISSVNFTMIEGGTSLSSTPDKCHLHCIINTIPEQDIDSIESQILDFIDGMKSKDPNLDITVQIPNKTKPTIADISSNFANAVKNAFKSVYNEEKEFKTLIPTTDVNHFHMKGIETILIGSLRGENNYHAQDEFVYIEDLINMTKIYAITAMNYLK